MLPAEDREQVKRYSSIDQYKCMLHVIEKGETLPITFDYLDKIDCKGRITSHKIIVKVGDWAGIHFPVATKKYRHTEILIGDYEDSEFYRDEDGELHEQTEALKVAVGGNGSLLGLTQEKELRVGLDYVWGDKTLEAVD